MKRKFASILSLILALTMILPMSSVVFANEPVVVQNGDETGNETGDETGEEPAPVEEPLEIMFGSEVVGSTISGYLGQTYALSARGGSGKYTWYSTNTDIADVVPSTGLVTPKKAGTVDICVTDGKNTASVEFNFEMNSCTGIKVDSYTAEYISGQSFDKSSLKITATFKDGSTKNLTGSDVTISPDGPLTAADEVVTVNYGEVSTNIKVKVTEKSVFSVSIINAKTKFTEGDSLPEFELLVTYNDKSTITLVSGYDVYVNNTKVTSSYTFKTTDTSVKLAFGGAESAALKITVSAKSNTPSTDGTYTIEMNKAPTKTEYREGDKFSYAGMTVNVYENVNGSKVAVSSSDVTVKISEYTITADDVKNKNYINLPVTLTMKAGENKGKSYSVVLKVTGLTLKEAAEELTVYAITEVSMEDSSYPVGYKFSLSDVEYFYYKETKNGKEYKVTGYEMLNTYSNDFDLEVLTNKNDKTASKSSRYMYTLEEDDVFTDTKKDTKYAYLRLTVDDEEYDFTVSVGGKGVYYYYDSDLIAVYDDIDEAIEYTMEQDKDVKNDFDLDRVKDSKNITLKLGEDQKVSAKTDFELCHNVTIDLSGNALEFYTDTVDITKLNKDYILTITNTSATASKFTYKDKDIEITLQKGDKLKFEYEGELPGIFTLKLDIGDNGKVVTVPATDKYSEITVGQGSDVKFTITPNEDYVLDTIKVDTKTVAAKDYTTSSKGVITYTLKAVSKSQDVKITFKKDDTAKNWKNPFNDVNTTDSYYTAVKFVYENNLFKGTTTTKFGPDTTMTRAMFVTVLGRLAGVDVTRFKTSSYTDVPLNSTTSWYAPYVEWATQMGLIEGYGDGTFGPDNKITHQQMYVLMYRYTVFVENQSVSVSNASINASDAEDVADWAKTAVKFASQKNFLVKVGTSSRIDPKGEAKRSELAQLLEKYCDIVLKWNEKD